MFTGRKIHGKFILALCLACLFIACSACAAEKPVTAYIPVSCTGKNTKEAFRYNLEYTASEHQKVKNTSLTLRDGETGKFEIEFDYADTYHFTVSQTPGTDANTTYDKTVYEADVYVTEDDNGILHSETVVYKKGSRDKAEKVEYINGKIEPDTGNKGASRDTDNAGSGNGSWTGKPVSETKTGDDSDVRGYSALLLLSLITAAFLLLKIRKKEEC